MADTTNNPAPARPAAFTLWVWGLTGLGLILRLLLLGVPDQYCYQSDHLTHWAWARQSLERGLFSTYGHQRPDCRFVFPAPVRLMVRERGRIAAATYPAGWSGAVRAMNQPPLQAVALHLLGWLHRSFDPAMVPLTPFAWGLYALPAVIADWLLAVGCLFIIRAGRGNGPGLIGFALIWFSPGFLLTGTLWGQWDSWFLAPLIWMVFCCLRQRWRSAGMLFAAALLLKAQALLAAPALLYFFIVRREWRGSGRFLAAALGTVLLVTAPFMARSGPAWVENSFIYNFTALLPFTTLNAFNLWALDLLAGHDLNLGLLVLGISKQGWGLFLAGLGLLLSILIVDRGDRRSDLDLPMLLALTYTVAFLFPTRVHERYVIYLLPFLLLAAAVEQRFWAIFTGWSVIALFEVTNHLWLAAPLNWTGLAPERIFLVSALAVGGLCLFIVWLVILARRPGRP